MREVRYSQAGLQALTHGQYVVLTPQNVQSMVPRGGEQAYKVIDVKDVPR